MFWHRPWDKLYRAVLVSGPLILCVVSSPLAGWDGAFATLQPLQAAVHQASASLSFVRVFSSADDVKAEHPVLDRTLDIIAGPADPEARVDTMRSPSAVTTDSNHRVFVADPGAQTVHIFDFIRSKYGRLDGRGDRLHVPVALAVDGQDNLYVVDQTSRTILVYDSAGKFRRYIHGLFATLPAPSLAHLVWAVDRSPLKVPLPNYRWQRSLAGLRLLTLNDSLESWLPVASKILATLARDSG